MLQQLGRSPVLGNLEMVDLGRWSNRMLSAEGLLAFAETCELPRLKRVEIVDVGNVPASALAALEARFEVLGYRP